MELEYREFEVRSVNDERRQVSGLAVPWDTATNIGDYKEQIARGAFGQPDTVALFYGHNHRNGGMPIGKVTAYRDTDAGLEIDAVISKTTDGNTVYTLLQDGVLNRFSVGFEPLEQSYSEDGTTVIRTKANLKEISIVPMPAYEQAKVAQVRDTSQKKEVDEMTSTVIETSEVVDVEARDRVTDLERKIVGLQTAAPAETETKSQFRSFAEYAKGLATGDEKALAEYRAYTGSTTADAVVNKGWVGDVVRLVDDNRKVLSAFSKGQWVKEGNSIDYAKLSSNTVIVSSQGAEGTDLPKGKVVVVAASAPKITYGGYVELSRQEIANSSVNMLDLSLRALAIQYAKSTNAAVRSALVGTVSGIHTATLSANTAAGWLSLLVDSAVALDAEGVSPEFMIVSADQYKKLASLTDGGRPLMDYGNGSNTIGNANASGLKGSLAGVPIILDAGLADNSCWVAHAEAIRTFEEPGAPLRLADENIINLTNAYSVYGQLAVGVQAPGLLVKCDVDLS